MPAEPTRHSTVSPATMLGLCLALVAPALPGFVDQLVFGPAQTSLRIDWGLVVHWANLAALLVVVFLAERQGLASIGLRPWRWWTVPLGLVAGVAIMAASGFAAAAFGAGGDARFATFLMSLPLATRVLVVVTAGVFEETLYRGYALERLATLFGNKWAAAGATVALFTLAHVPAVGFAHLLPVFIASSLVTALYLWRRDLVINIVAHATVDGIPLLLAPALAHHGR